MRKRLFKRKIHYTYNPETAKYEPQPFSYRRLLVQIGSHSIAGILTGLLFFAIFVFTFNTPSERSLRNENIALQAQYNVLQSRLDAYQGVLSDIQSRDNNMYRVLLHTDSLPTSVRKGSLSPARYESLLRSTNSQLAVEMTEQTDIIAKELYVQSKSFDELGQLAMQKEKMLRCIPAIQPVLNKDLRLITSGFGVRIDPVYKTARFHAGMDFSAPQDTKVFATGDGVITFVGWDQGLGNTVIIDHGFGYESVYAHLDNTNERKGVKVRRGDVIGAVGESGKATGYHLHYEVHYKGTPVNPINYFFMDLSPKEYDKMILQSNRMGETLD